MYSHSIVDVREVEPDEVPAKVKPATTEPAPPDLPAVPAIGNIGAVEESGGLHFKVVVAEVNRTAANRAGLGFPRETMCVEGRDAFQMLDRLQRSKCAQTLAEETVALADGRTNAYDATGQIELAPLAEGGAKVPFVVRLALTPTLLDGQRIRLVVAANLRGRNLTQGMKPQGFSVTLNLNHDQTLLMADLLPLHVPGDGVGDRDVIMLITPELAK